MRIALLVMASALVTGCSAGANTAGNRTESGSTSPVTSSVSASSSAPPTTTSAGARSVPEAGAAIGEVIAYVEAGRPAQPSSFRSATRDGAVTDLGDDVAFTSGAVNCMTDRRSDGALACLVDLANPPPPPAEIYGQWKGGWVDFEGISAEVGSAHGDPGRFGNGRGPELGSGQSLAFGDYRCRADATGVFCVNYAHQSAVEFSRAGIEPFGCLRQVPAPADVGIKFSCEP